MTLALPPLPGRREQRLAAPDVPCGAVTPRYTFAASSRCRRGWWSPTASRHAEGPAPGRLRRAAPAQAVAQVGAQHPVAAQLRDNEYVFEIPSQLDPAAMQVRLGDASHRIRIEPTLRPPS
ncbi:MAG: hypothetical protein U0790_12600 [Isosphaeraceae bacterium]